MLGTVKGLWSANKKKCCSGVDPPAVDDVLVNGSAESTSVTAEDSGAASSNVVTAIMEDIQVGGD